MKNTLATSALVLVLGALSPAALVSTAEVAHAGEKADPSKSPAKDDILLTQGQVGSLEKKLADKADWASDAKARESARTSLQSVTAGMKRIRAADPKWDLSAWDALVKSAEARLKKADEAVAAAGAEDAKATEAFSKYRSEQSKVEDTLKLLGQVQGKPAEVPIVSEQIFQKTVPAIASVAGLVKVCKDTGVAKLPTPTGYKGTNAAEGCKLAGSWKELGKTYVLLQAKGGAKAEAERLTKVIERMKKGESIDASRHQDLLDPKKSVERTKKVYVEGAKTFEAAVDDATFEPIVAAAKPYAEALVEAGKVSRWDKAAKLPDAAVAAAIAGDHTKGGGMEVGKLVKHGSFTDWFVEKDVFGVPVRRSRDFKALVQITGETYCRLYGRPFEASFKNGAWSKPYSTGGQATFRISSCK